MHICTDVTDASHRILLSRNSSTSAVSINLLDSAIGGYRSTAFAFGQTGAGKTYTIVGPENTPKPGTPSDGILGNSLTYLFDKLNSLGVKYVLRMSCTEIYKEQVYDLMAEGNDRENSTCK